VNANTVASQYGLLTPEERFRLVVLAAERGDHAERQRLANAGGRITLSLADSSPYGQAFGELAVLVFLDLLDEAAGYVEVVVLATKARDTPKAAAAAEDGEGGEGPAAGEHAEDAAAGEEEIPGAGDKYNQPTRVRRLDLVLAAGFVLRAKADGWKLFCERRSIPPFWLWDGLPGFDRVRRAVDLAGEAAFTREGMRSWLNGIRHAGKPEVTEAELISAAAYADRLEALFRRQVGWWGG